MFPFKRIINLMKTSLIAFSYICFALIGITTSAAVPEPVLDTSGQKLTTGVKYYILPVVKSGGLTLESTGNKSCPISVVQSKFKDGNGDTVTFTPYNAKDGAILTSTDLNIITTPIKSPCGPSFVWRLLKESTGLWFVALGGVEGNPGADTIVNWFKIEKAGKHYVLSFCPSVCKCNTLCRELGIYVDGVDKHLALSDKVTPFKVMFKRAQV
ncbi:kunitz trypsin inhibitor 5-like [Lotus japonicus]|uniref:kunitz trypsin inhibitor 5-like n=1 Tax=Lotus japonicus TaxID=34305 RepID=UPI00258EB9A4|nr:kunitz trypsin inhibitor 5-like [Lotus japonicus]